jgi:Aldo/keto reductase family
LRAHDLSPVFAWEVALTALLSEGRDWLLAKPVATSIIIGAKRLDQLQDNLAAIKLALTQDGLRQLDEASALPPEYPGWVLPFQGADRLGPADRWERLGEASKAN